MDRDHTDDLDDQDRAFAIDPAHIGASPQGQAELRQPGKTHVAQQAADAATVDDDPTTDEDAESEIGEEDTESGENEQT